MTTTATNQPHGGLDARDRWLSRRAAMRVGGVGAMAAAMGLWARPGAAAGQKESGPTRREAEAIGRGITDALASDPDALEDWVAEDVVGHVPLAPKGSGKGLNGLKAKAAAVIAAFPDAAITVEDLAVDGDRVSAHGEIRGTHDGPLPGFPATGKRVRVQYVIFARVERGKVAEYWYQLDTLGALKQLELFALDGGNEGDAAPTPDGDS